MLKINLTSVPPEMEGSPPVNDNDAKSSVTHFIGTDTSQVLDKLLGQPDNSRFVKTPTPPESSTAQPASKILLIMPKGLFKETSQYWNQNDGKPVTTHKITHAQNPDETPHYFPELIAEVIDGEGAIMLPNGYTLQELPEKDGIQKFEVVKIQNEQNHLDFSDSLLDNKLFFPGSPGEIEGLLQKYHPSTSNITAATIQEVPNSTPFEELSVDNQRERLQDWMRECHVSMLDISKPPLSIRDYKTIHSYFSNGWSINFKNEDISKFKQYFKGKGGNLDQETIKIKGVIINKDEQFAKIVEFLEKSPHGAQKELAKILEVTANTVTHWKKGHIKKLSSPFSTQQMLELEQKFHDFNWRKSATKTQADA